jgi:hypothetical protein
VNHQYVGLGIVNCALVFAMGCSGSDGASVLGSGGLPGAGGAPSQMGSGGSAPGSLDTPPCNVQTVLQEHCWTCHGTESKYGAPTLVTASAFRGTSHKDPSRSVGALAAIRVQDPTQLMPPAGNPSLSSAEVGVIQAWASAGNPAGAACGAPPGSGGAGQVGGGGAAPIGSGGAFLIGSGGTSPIGSGGAFPIGSGGTSPVGSGGTGPIGTGGSGAVDLPPDAVCYEIRARQDKSNAPFQVPTTPDYYSEFSYSVPWGSKKVQVIRMRSLIDNDKVIHHWLLYNNQGAVTDGANSSGIGAHPDASLTVGWAPGNEPPVLPADVGLGVPGQGFTLEVHYNNTIGAGQTDKSGVEVCVTENLRAHEAQVSWLGTQQLNKVSASGTCTPKLNGPVNVLFSWPHEHLQGRHLKTVINRVGGAQEVLVDKAFDFNAQVVYSTPAVINPGDSLTTTCTFAQPTPFGQGTTSEMCYNFVTAYPGGALTNGPSFLRINDCTQ